jgi:gamma-glutamyl-gamma-aminobutyrate hydrolase PuuD
MTDLYFAYGSNLKLSRMRERVPSARALGPARLLGHSLGFDKCGRDGSTKANLIADDGESVWGALYQIDAAHWEGLDGYERGYARSAVEVEKPGGARVTAQTYRAVGPTADGPIFDWYLRLIVEGAREHGLPAAYLENLERVPSRPDPRRPESPGRALIGIPLCLDERGRWKPGREYHYVDAAYARAVEGCGGSAVYLPPREDAAELARRIDGLLLPGGDDFPPARPYPKSVRFDPVPARQVDFDRRLLAAALERGLPVLAICYGMQLLAVHHGGRLLYHIPTDVREAGPHRLPESDGRHALRVESATRLARVLGEKPEPVNSLHHQGVAEPGAGLRVCARADDGLIEAIESDGDSFCIGVQWHPEKMSGPHRDRLFGAFVSACNKT